MVSALNKISQKTELVTNDAIKTDKLAKEGATKSNKAIASLSAVRNLLTEHQKLSQALQAYTNKVVDIAKRVAVVADTARFFSLNMSIEANKTALSEDFVDLVAQLRDLNMASETAASSIQNLSEEMRRHIEQSKQSTIFEWQETNKSIDTVVQTLNFFDKIIKNVAQITDNIQVINQESSSTYQKAGDINTMIKDLTKQSQLLVKQTDDITKVIQNQLVVTRSLNKSSLSLNEVTDSLDNLVGSK
jgi:methyl-accepting chemotaxis protein